MAVGGVSPLNAANITHLLSGIDFPKRKNEIVDFCRKKGTDNTVITVLEKLPDREYQSMADVMKAYGEIRELKAA